LAEKTITFDNFIYLGEDVDCEIKVWYVQRHACNQFYDVQILKVEVTNPNNNDCPFSINDQTEAMDFIHQKLLKENPMGFPEQSKPSNPGNENCNGNWRVSNGSCYKSVEGTFKPCDQNNDRCCLTRYEVCRDDCGNLTVEKTSAQGSGNCDSEACDFVCQ